jgi:hypothetical protein
MTTQTRETLKALSEILRVAAERRLLAGSHDPGSFTMHAIANEIVIALTLPDPALRSATQGAKESASREYTGASGNDE